MNWLLTAFLTLSIAPLWSQKIEPNPSPTVLDGIEIPEHIPTTKCFIWKPLKHFPYWMQTIDLIKNPLNMDSLKLLLNYSNRFRKTNRKIQYLDTVFSRFISYDSTLWLDIFMDDKGEFCEHIGLSIVFRRYNKNDQLISKIGYNKKGELFLWDYEPVQIYSYQNNKVICKSYDHNKKFLFGSIKTYDSLNREISLEYFDVGHKLSHMTSFEYIDRTNEIIQKELNKDKELTGRFGFAILYKKFNKDKTFVIEEKYFDENNKLFDDTHNQMLSSDHAFSIIRRKKIGKKINAQYFNSKGKLVFEMYYKIE